MLSKHRLRATDEACVHRELETVSSLMLGKDRLDHVMEK